MKISKGLIMGIFATIAVLLAGCDEDEKTAADVVEPEIVEEVEAQQEEDAVVDAYWSQPVDSEICQTVGECRDVGDEYGNDHFSSLSGNLKSSNLMWYLSVGTIDDENVLAFGAADQEDEELLTARYEIREDEFVLTSGEETDAFKDLTELVLALYDLNKINMQTLDFKEDVYPYVLAHEEKLVLPSNLITHWLQSRTVATLIHEYGHFLTMKQEEFVITDTCPADQLYMNPYGMCYNADSYLNLFYQAFLKEYEEQWLDDSIRTSEERLAFYEKHKDSFVTTYATVNPIEDIAESFTYFMLTPYNDNPQTVPEEKINFFYQFPELVEYRALVLKELDEMWSF